MHWFILEDSAKKYYRLTHFFAESSKINQLGQQDTSQIIQGGEFESLYPLSIYDYYI